MRWRLSNQKTVEEPSPTVERADRRVVAGWPGRACCCPAAPQVKVVLPAGEERRRAVDLYLCGHHYRSSRDSLAAVGAAVYDELGRVDALPVG